MFCTGFNAAKASSLAILVVRTLCKTNLCYRSATYRAIYTWNSRLKMFAPHSRDKKDCCFQLGKRILTVNLEPKWYIMHGQMTVWWMYNYSPFVLFVTNWYAWPTMCIHPSVILFQSFTRRKLTIRWLKRMLWGKDMRKKCSFLSRKEECYLMTSIANGGSIKGKR